MKRYSKELYFGVLCVVGFLFPFFFFSFCCVSFQAFIFILGFLFVFFFALVFFFFLHIAFLFS